MVPFHRGSRAGMPDLAMAQQPGMCLWPVLLCISLEPFPPAACAASHLLTHSAQALALLLKFTKFMSCKSHLHVLANTSKGVKGMTDLYHAAIQSLGCR